MSIISDALEQEREIEKSYKEARRAAVDQYQNPNGGGKISLLNGPKPPGVQKLTVPGKQ